MLILASTSPRRIELLKTLKINFESIAPSFEEDHENCKFLILPPHLIPVRFAYEKAISIYNDYPENIIVGSDTIVTLEEKLLGKPKTREESIKFLLSLSGKKHCVITGVAIICKRLNLQCTFSETSNVYFKSINKTTAEKYVSLVNTLDKAGAYAIQEQSELIIEKYEGSNNNIVGLPTEKLILALKNIESTFSIAL